MNFQCYFLLLIGMASYYACYSTSSVKRSFKLTVDSALQLPSADDIKRELELRGGTYTPQAEQTITQYLKNILQGTLPSVELSSNLQKSRILIASQALNGILRNTQVFTAAQGALSKIQTLIPSLTTTFLMKDLATACKNVHTSISHQKEIVQAQENALNASLLLSIAQHYAVECIIQLLFILYSPQSKPCQRMHSLYLLNTINLLGNQGLVFTRWRARSNRFYFTQEGLLIEFDPSRNNAQIPKRIKALDTFLKTVARSRSDYLHSLQAGATHGIAGLNEYYQKALGQSWDTKINRYAWHYAAGIFKEATSIDVMYIRTVDPERIFAHAENKDFLNLMLLTSTDEVQSTGSTSLNAAQEIITRYMNYQPNKKITGILKSYFIALEKRSIT